MIQVGSYYATKGRLSRAVIITHVVEAPNGNAVMYQPLETNDGNDMATAPRKVVPVELFLERYAPINIDRDGLLTWAEPIVEAAKRVELPQRVKATTAKVKFLGGRSLFVSIGYYEDDKPGEVFLSIGREGTEMSDMLAVIGITISLALQHGVPLDIFLKHLKSFKEGTTPPKIAEGIEEALKNDAVTIGSASKGGEGGDPQSGGDEV